MTTLIETFQSDKIYRLDFTIQDADENAIDLTYGTPVFKAQKQNGTALKFSGNMTVGTPTAGMCYYTVQATDFDEIGDYWAEIEVTYGTPSGKVITLGDIVVKVKPQLPRSI